MVVIRVVDVIGDGKSSRCSIISSYSKSISSSGNLQILAVLLRKKYENLIIYTGLAINDHQSDRLQLSALAQAF